MKNLPRNVKLLLAVIIVWVLFSACSSTYKAYSSKAISRNHEAVLIIGRWQDAMTGRGELQVDMIDGQPISETPDRIALLPGDHIIRIGGFVSSGIYKKNITSSDYKIYLEAGRTYRLFIEDSRNPVMIFHEESN